MTVAGEEVSGTIIDRDLACAQCRYNLRGLPVEGKCPECGVLVGATLRIEEERRSIAVRPLTDRRMVNDLIEGCVITLVSFSIALGVAFVPAWAFAYRTRSRSILLGVVVTCWVLSFFGGWKLSAPDRQHMFEPKATARRILRYSLIAMFAGLVLCYLLEPVIHNWVLPIGIFAFVAWFFAAAAYYIHVGRLLEALGSSVLTAICFAMMVINTLAMLAIFVPQGHGDSLAGFHATPTMSFGGASYVAETIRALGQGGFEWWVGLWLILYTTVLVIHVRLLVLLMRTDKELKQRGMETRRVRIY